MNDQDKSDKSPIVRPPVNESALPFEMNSQELYMRLEQKEINYRILFETAHDAIFLMDEKIFLDCNPRATKIFGCTREDIIGKSPTDFSPPLQPDGSDSTIRAREKIELAMAGQSQVFEWEQSKKDGTPFDAEVSLNAVPLDGKILIQAIVRDISKRKRSEEQLLKYNTELQELNQTKDKFFSIISHDLKGPFNAILGFSDILATEWNDYTDEERQHFIRNIHSSAKNTFRLLENLLEWSMAQTGKLAFRPAPFDLSVVANDVIILMREQADAKQIKLFTAINFHTMVLADENMIKTILRNLVSNAIKYTQPGGHVKILTETIAKTSENRGMLQVCVHDSGIGINPEMLPKLFRIDEKVRSSGTAQEKGTGLGLILCKELVEKNGGIIFVKSEPEKGSRFCFTIPVE
jgi:PAS domain S-box-containing protein